MSKELILSPDDIRFSNGLLAEFLGYYRDTDFPDTWFFNSKHAIHIVAVDAVRDRHKSDYWQPDNNWNQLMMVFEKVASIPPLPEVIDESKLKYKDVFIEKIEFRWNVGSIGWFDVTKTGLRRHHISRSTHFEGCKPGIYLLWNMLVEFAMCNPNLK